MILLMILIQNITFSPVDSVRVGVASYKNDLFSIMLGGPAVIGNYKYKVIDFKDNYKVDLDTITRFRQIVSKISIPLISCFSSSNVIEPEINFLTSDDFLNKKVMYCDGDYIDGTTSLSCSDTGLYHPNSVRTITKCLNLAEIMTPEPSKDVRIVKVGPFKSLVKLKEVELSTCGNQPVNRLFLICNLFSGYHQRISQELADI